MGKQKNVGSGPSKYDVLVKGKYVNLPKRYVIRCHTDTKALSNPYLNFKKGQFVGIDDAPTSDIQSVAIFFASECRYIWEDAFSPEDYINAKLKKIIPDYKGSYLYGDFFEPLSFDISV